MDLRTELRPILEQPTGTSSAGYPYLSRIAWARLRDWIPHTFAAGAALLDTVEELAGDAPADALRVVGQVVRTAAITAPPDLWLVRQVVGALASEGWLERLAKGVEVVPAALEPDVTLLLARGYLVRWGAGFRWSQDPTAQRVLEETGPLPDWPGDLSRRWVEALTGVRDHDELLLEVLADLPPHVPHPPPAWVATPEDLDVGFRLVGLVLGLRGAGCIDAARTGLPLPEPLRGQTEALLARAGWWSDRGPTPLGRRGLRRGPGPFGIIETYHPYLSALPRIWREGASAVHVERAGNVAASQDANRATFRKANDALDRYCADTGFDYTVFVEHAVGRGEATRQRFARDGHKRTYVGADLEQAALDAAKAEQAAGRLPESMRFVQADIGAPDVLVDALRAHGLDPRGAVMLVGNGFHEVRQQTDARMVEVFRGYADAGMLLLFAEESALAVDDLLRTAFNTYHAGFRYVHERSGQGLRPASPTPEPGLGPKLRASWEECASRAGYQRADAYCVPSRTIYPYTPANGHNPSVSVSHFFVPPDRPGP